MNITPSASTSSAQIFQRNLAPDGELLESSWPTKVLYVIGVAAVIAEVVIGVLHFQFGLFPDHTLLADGLLGGGGGLLLGGALTIIYNWHQSRKIVPLDKMLKTTAPKDARSSGSEEDEHPIKLRCATSSVALISLLVLTAIGLIYFLQVWKWTPPDFLQSRVTFELSGVGGILLGVPLYNYGIYPLLKCLNK
jgi:hypothetical protein